MDRRITLWSRLCRANGTKGLNFGTLAVVSSVYSAFLPPVRGAVSLFLLPDRDLVVGKACLAHLDIHGHTLIRIERGN